MQQKHLSEKALAHQREYQRQYRARMKAKKAAERAASREPPPSIGRPQQVVSDYIPARLYKTHIDSLRYWPKLMTLMAQHKDWTVSKCKAKIAQELRENKPTTINQ